MVGLEEFMISEEVLERLNDKEALLQQIDEGKTMQELFGFSNDATADFYEAAQEILEQSRFEDATKAFSFLTVLNPNMSPFWTGLGMAQQNLRDYESAIFSFSMSYTLEETSISSYMLAAQCFMEIKDFGQAVEVLEIAEDFAKEHPEIPECKQLQKDAVAAKAYVLSKKH